MFHKLHSKERINRRAQSQGPPSPHFGHHRNNVEIWFCGEGGGSNWFERYCAADNSEQQADDPSYLTFLPWISLEAMTKDFFAIPDFLENSPHPSFGINVLRVFSCLGYQFNLCNRLRTYQDPAKSAVHYRNGVFHLTATEILRMHKSNNRLHKFNGRLKKSNSR